MKSLFVCLLLLPVQTSWAQASKSRQRLEAEYYVAAYARHYHVPVTLVEAIVKRESDWQPCAVSPKGAVGLMQLMPITAERLGVRDRCNIDQNVSGGVRHLAWLIQRFGGDFRLVSAAYYAGEDVVVRRGLAYRNADVVDYVSRIRATYMRLVKAQSSISKTVEKRDIR